MASKMSLRINEPVLSLEISVYFRIPLFKLDVIEASEPQSALGALILATNNTQIGWIALKFKQALMKHQMTRARTDQVRKRSEEQRQAAADYRQFWLAEHPMINHVGHGRRMECLFIVRHIRSVSDNVNFQGGNI
jgi:hypothetical protein